MAAVIRCLKIPLRPAKVQETHQDPTKASTCVSRDTPYAGLRDAVVTTRRKSFRKPTPGAETARTGRCRDAVTAPSALEEFSLPPGAIALVPQRSCVVRAPDSQIGPKSPSLSQRPDRHCSRRTGACRQSLLPTTSPGTARRGWRAIHRPRTGRAPTPCWRLLFFGEFYVALSQAAQQQFQLGGVELFALLTEEPPGQGIELLAQNGVLAAGLLQRLLQ